MATSTSNALSYVKFDMANKVANNSLTVTIQFDLIMRNFEGDPALPALALYQLTNGCEAIECENPECARCETFWHVDNLRERHERLMDNIEWLCLDTLPPIVAKPEIVPIVVNFASFGQQLMVRQGTNIPPPFEDMNAFCYFWISQNTDLDETNLQMENSYYEDLCSIVDENFDKLVQYETSYFELVNSFSCTKKPFTFSLLRGMLNLFVFSKFFISGSHLNVRLDLFQRFASMGSAEISVLVNALVGCPELLKRMLNSIQETLSAFNKGKVCGVHDQHNHQMAGLIEILADANWRTKDPLPAEAFVNSELNMHVFAEREYRLLVQGFSSYLDTSAVLSRATKSAILSVASTVIGNAQITVHRETMIDEFFTLVNSNSSVLSGRVTVNFEGEPGQDMGGVTREFFYLLADNLFNKSGLFSRTENGTLWLVPNTLFQEDNRQKLVAAGALMIMAMSSGVFLPVDFPLALYKKLKNEPLVLRDYADLYPQEAASLASLKQLYEQGEDPYLYFSVTEKTPSGTVEVPLIPSGETREVTLENVDEYVKLLVEYYLTERVSISFCALQEGFFTIGTTDVTSKLTFLDYSILIGGSPQIDWDAFKNCVVYSNYQRSSQSVCLFWTVFDELSEADKCRMLQFMTGSARPPADGFRSMRIVFEKSESNSLPVAHTCMRTFLLPCTHDIERMRFNVRMCVANNTGFGIA